MGEEQRSAGDQIPPNSERIEIRIAELRQLFNAMDASPFRERDLDPGAEAFVVGWAREAPRAAHLALVVELGRTQGLADEPAALRGAIREFFARRAHVTRSRMRGLLRTGRVSLLVGLAFLTAALGLGDLLAAAIKGHRIGELLRQGLVICGWVAMWRPLEIFLYGWWPIRREARLYDRLSAMPVRIVYTGNAEPDAWRRDWPAVSPAQVPPRKAPRRAAVVRGAHATQAGAVSVPERGPISPSVIGADSAERVT